MKRKSQLPKANPGRKASPVKRPTISPLRLRRILVPIDFSPRSRQALQTAVLMARKYGGKLLLVHVVQTPTISAWQVVPGGNHYLNLDLKAVADIAKRELDEALLDEVPSGFRGRSLVRQGNAHSEIVNAARQVKADLIVMSTHGHTGIERVLVGSVTENVVRHAPCSVLTLHQP